MDSWDVDFGKHTIFEIKNTVKRQQNYWRIFLYAEVVVALLLIW